MAISKVTPVKAGHNALSATDVTFTAIGADGIYFEVEQDERLLLLVKNAHGSTAYDIEIKVGDGVNGYAGNANGEFPIEITAGKTYAMTLDSSRFAQTSGTYKGCIRCDAEDATNVQIALVKLP